MFFINTVVMKESKRIKQQEKNNLVFFAMGEMYNKQCLYAILSLINVYEESLPNWLHIYIYTDQPRLFSLLENQYEINIISVDENKVEEWLLGKDYFLITKISLVKEFLISHSGNMIFVDTDVIFKRKLDSTFRKVANGKYVLHLREEKLSSPGNKHYVKTFQNKKFILESGRTISIDKKSEMWNSGLIGISSDCIDVVDDVLSLCLQLLPHSSSRFLEQLSFSLVFKDTGRLVGDPKIMVHYWWKKSLFNPIINEALKNTEVDLKTLLSKVEALDPTNRTKAKRLFYNLHPNGLLRKSIVKSSLLFKTPIH